MYEINYNGQTSYYFYCSIRLEGLLYDAEHDLLAISKLLVLFCLVALSMVSSLDALLPFWWTCNWRNIYCCCCLQHKKI